MYACVYIYIYIYHMHADSVSYACLDGRADGADVVDVGRAVAQCWQLSSV